MRRDPDGIWHKAGGWAGLLLLTTICVGLLECLHQPAALLLGAMLAAVMLAVSGRTPALPSQALAMAQGVVGCMIARCIRLPALQQMILHWPVFLGGVMAVAAVSYLLGWLLMRWQVLPGNAAIWGASPGGATAMVVLAESLGADVRLVAFMQYARVILVALMASVVASLLSSPSPPTGGGTGWWAPVSWRWLLATLPLAASGWWLRCWLRVPAAALLLPLVLGSLLQDVEGFRIELPRPLLAISYALIGWHIGLRFSLHTLRAVVRAMPVVVLSTLCLLALCGGLSVLVAHWLKMDPLSAYLAMSPGGVDSVAIIAAASPDVDVSFVMAMQTARFLLILLAGPWLTRWLAGRAAIHPRRCSTTRPDTVRITMAGAVVRGTGEAEEAEAEQQPDQIDGEHAASQGVGTGPQPGQ